MNELTHLDLFSGIGGFALAAKWNGYRTLAFCDNEPYAQAVLKKHWPDVESLFSQADSRASHSVLRCESTEREQQIPAISGRKCFALYGNQGPLGLLEKMLLESSTWHSNWYTLTWKQTVTKCGHLLFQLAASVLGTSGIGSGLWPTPAASRWKPVNWKRAETGWRAWDTLENAVARVEFLEGRAKRGMSLQITPEFCEWLMGYPIGWTELDASETPSSRKSRQKSSDASTR